MDGGVGSYCLTGPEFLFGKTEKVWPWMVAMAAQHCEYSRRIVHFQMAKILRCVYFTTTRIVLKEERGKKDRAEQTKVRGQIWPVCSSRLGHPCLKCYPWPVIAPSPHILRILQVLVQMSPLFVPQGGRTGTFGPTTAAASLLRVTGSPTDHSLHPILSSSGALHPFLLRPGPCRHVSLQPSQTVRLLGAALFSRVLSCNSVP